MKENDIEGKNLVTFVKHIIYQQCVSKLSIMIYIYFKQFLFYGKQFCHEPKDVMFSMNL
jgi:nucleosome binding factor SPN SPT16 subunit